MNRKLRHILVFLFCLPASRSFPEEQTKEGEIIAYDDQNRFSFHHVGSGKTRLDIVRGGRSEPVILDHRAEPYRGIIPEKSIRRVLFKGRDQVWMTFRCGHRLDSAIVFDLQRKEIVDSYMGKLFAFSPDGAHVAYCYPSEHSFNHNILGRMVVIVDHSAVYPMQKDGLQFKDLVVLQDATGREIGASLPPEYENVEFGPAGSDNPIHWIDNSTLQVTLDEVPGTAVGQPDENQITRFYRIEIKGTTDAKGAFKVKDIRKVPISREEALKDNK